MISRWFVVVLLFLTVTLLPAQTEFSQDSAAAIDRILSVDIGPRPMGSPAEQRALRFAVEQFKRYGLDTAYLMPMTYTDRDNTSSGVAVGIKRGETKRIILIGGHIDSAAPEVPGADDDGSGAAVVIETARVLGKSKPHSTLIFCCFGGEEQGLEGSQYFVDHFPEIDSVDLMLQVDMANGLDILNIDPDTHGISAPQWLVSAAADEFYKLGYTNLVYPTHFFSLDYAQGQGAGSDHESFLDRGIPAIDFTTDVDRPIHTPRDNFDNLQVAGLKRSGDLVINLFKRFDHGIPDRKLDTYWLYLLGRTPIFIQLWGVQLFLLITALLTITAVRKVWRNRVPRSSPNRIRWSGLKTILFSLVIVSFGWFSSDLIGLIRGVRHPWLSSIGSYYVLAAIAVAIGMWVSLRLTSKIRLSPDPYVFFIRSVIIFTLFLIGLGLVGLKLTIEPATALLLISLAIVVRNPLLKLVFILLSPWWMLRLIFSEWIPLLFRALAHENTTEAAKWIIMNGGSVVGLTIYILPLLYGIIAALKTSPGLRMLVISMKARFVVAILAIVFIGWAIHLLMMPVFTNLWYRDVAIEERYDMDDHSKEVSCRSGEYLDGFRISHDGKDSAVTSKTLFVKITPSVEFDTSWVTIQRQQQSTQSGNVIDHALSLKLSAKQRPYTVSLTYSSGGKKIEGFETSYKFHSMKDKSYRIDWYSFPDSMLEIPVRFQTAANDSVQETIEVTFDTLADPIRCNEDWTYFIPRTTYVSNFVYR